MLLLLNKNREFLNPFSLTSSVYSWIDPYDMDTITFNVSDEVILVDDKGTQALQWSPPGAVAPTWNALLRAMVFNGTSQYLKLPGSSNEGPFHRPGTLIMVLGLTPIDGIRYIMGSSASSGERGISLAYDNRSSNSYGRRLFWQVSNGTAYVINEAISRFPDGEWGNAETMMIGIQTYDTGDARLSINGIVTNMVLRNGTQAFSSNDLPGRDMTIGTVGGGYANMTLREMIFFDDVQLSLADMKRVQRAMNAKHSIADMRLATPKPTYIFLGQSNDRGNNSDATEGTPAFSTSNSKCIFSRQDTQDFIVDVIGRHDEAAGNGAIGPQSTFAADMATYHSDEVIIIKAAYGGTGLNANWFNTTSGELPTLTAAKAKIDGHLQELADINMNYEIKGLIWDQAENDFLTSVAANAYEANLEGIIANLREYLGIPDLPVVCSKQDNDDAVEYEFAPTVLTAIDNVAAADSNVAVADYRPWSFNTIGSEINVSGITQANPGVVTANGHGLSNGWSVIFTNDGGMTELSGNTYIVSNATTNTFELQEVDGGAYVDVDTSGFTAYSSGGTIVRGDKIHADGATNKGRGSDDTGGFAAVMQTLVSA